MFMSFTVEFIFTICDSKQQWILYLQCVSSDVDMVYGRSKDGCLINEVCCMKLVSLKSSQRFEKLKVMTGLYRVYSVGLQSDVFWQ